MEPNKKTKQQPKTAADLEREQLFAAADEEAAKGQQTTIDPEGEVKSRREFLDTAMSAADNPEDKYTIYYQGIRKLLMDFLPKGPKYKKMRDYIYEEKNIFLTRGKAKNSRGIRGGDGRMTYQPDMQQILDETIAWILASRTPTDIYNRYWQLNVRMGYPHGSHFVKSTSSK